MMRVPTKEIPGESNLQGKDIIIQEEQTYHQL